MRYLFTILLALLLAPSPTLSAENVVIHGGSDYKPFTYMEDGTPKGLYVELVAAVLDRMSGYRYTMPISPWGRLLKGVENGEIFAFFPPYYRPEQRPYVVPYSKPIYTETTILLCRNSINASRDFTHWPESAHGLTIGMNIGNLAGGPEYNEAVKDGYIRQISNKTPYHSLKMLDAGRLDCFIDSRMIVLDTIRSHPDLHGLHAHASETMAIRKESVHLGFSRFNNPPYKHDFIHEFNRALDRLKESGEYDTIVQRYESRY